MKFAFLFVIIAFLFLFMKREDRPVQSVKKAPLIKSEIIAPSQQIPDSRKTYVIQENITEESIEEFSFDPDRMYDFLADVEPQHADEIYVKFLDEKYAHEDRLNQNLVIALNQFSALNGESGVDPELNPSDPKQLEKQHHENVKHILGDHYDYIKEQELNFRDDLDSRF